MKKAILIVLGCMTLAACGGTTEKTVVVNPPPGSVTTVDQDGHTHITAPAQ